MFFDVLCLVNTKSDIQNLYNEKQNPQLIFYTLVALVTLTLFGQFRPFKIFTILLFVLFVCNYLRWQIYKCFGYQLAGEGYSVQKTLRGCATNMGSKISLLVYKWPLIKCKIWYINGVDFSKCSQIWAKIGWIIRKFWKKSGDFAQNLADWYMNGSFFSWKIGICLGLLSNFAVAYPYQTKLKYPPGPISLLHDVVHKKVKVRLEISVSGLSLFHFFSTKLYVTFILESLCSSILSWDQYTNIYQQHVGILISDLKLS